MTAKDPADAVPSNREGEEEAREPEPWLDRARGPGSPWPIRFPASLLAAISASALVLITLPIGLLGGVLAGLLAFLPLLVVVLVTDRAYDRFGIVAVWVFLATLFAWLIWKIRKDLRTD